MERQCVTCKHYDQDRMPDDAARHAGTAHEWCELSWNYFNAAASSDDQESCLKCRREMLEKVEASWGWLRGVVTATINIHKSGINPQSAEMVRKLEKVLLQARESLENDNPFRSTFG